MPCGNDGGGVVLTGVAGAGVDAVVVEDGAQALVLGAEPTDFDRVRGLLGLPGGDVFPAVTWLGVTCERGGAEVAAPGGSRAAATGPGRCRGR